MHQDHHELLELLGFIYLRNARPEKAETVYAALCALAPRVPRYAIAYAVALLRCDQPEKALQRLDRLLERGEVGAPVHLLRGQALARLGREAEAERALKAYVAARSAEVTPATGAAA